MYLCTVPAIGAMLFLWGSGGGGVEGLGITPISLYVSDQILGISSDLTIAVPSCHTITLFVSHLILPGVVLKFNTGTASARAW